MKWIELDLLTYCSYESSNHGQEESTKNMQYLDFNSIQSRIYTWQEKLNTILRAEKRVRDLLQVIYKIT